MHDTCLPTLLSLIRHENIQSLEIVVSETDDAWYSNYINRNLEKEIHNTDYQKDNGKKIRYLG